MSGQIDTLWQRPWAKRVDSIRLSLNNFIILAQEYLSEIKAAQGSVLSVYEIFSEREDIWPDQCDYAITAIQTLSEPLQDFCLLLDKAVHLPVAIAPFRYQLVITLHHINDQIRKLNLLIRTFRSTCRISSKEVTKQRYEIYCRLESLLYVGEDIVQESNILFDQARFLRNDD